MYLHSLCDTLAHFIHDHDPDHIGSILANALELGALTIMLILVLRLFSKVKDLSARMKEYHPDVSDDDIDTK
jgi:hypothetical protein